MSDAAPETAPRVSQMLRRLDEIRRELDREDVDLEDQLLLYKEGVRLASEARRVINEAVTEVEVLGEEGPA